MSAGIELLVLTSKWRPTLAKKRYAFRYVCMKRMSLNNTQIVPTVGIGVALHRLLPGQVFRSPILWQEKESVITALLDNHKLIIWRLI